ncbi:MAG: hypothetical protein RL315_405, partial [Actinomycetota bacterium]
MLQLNGGRLEPGEAPATTELSLLSPAQELLQ